MEKIKRGIICCILLFGLTNFETNFAASTFFDIILITQNSAVMWKDEIKPGAGFVTGFFCVNPGVNVTMESLKNVDSVLINQRKLKFKNFFYLDTTFFPTKSPATWNIYGSNGFPSFIFTNNDSIPKYNGYNSLPDTIFDSQDVILNINNYMYADSVEVWLSDTSAVIKHGLSNPGSTTFTSSELGSLFNSTQEGCITIRLTKNSNEVIEGKRVKFINRYCFMKYITFVSNNNNSRIGR